MAGALAAVAVTLVAVLVMSMLGVADCLIRRTGCFKKKNSEAPNYWVPKKYPRD